MSVGAVDIGTNSMRVLVLGDDGKTLHREVRVTGLGTGLDQTGRLAEGPMEKTLETLKDYARWLEDCRSVRVVATAASRDAENGAEFVDRATEALGQRPEVISGDEEARLAYRGAVGAVQLPSDAFPIVVDIGGGSTEFVTADDAVSCRIGSVRLTDRILSERPATFARLETAVVEVSKAIPVDPVDGRTYGVIGVAGTWTSLAALVLERYDPAEVHGFHLERLDVDRLISRLAALGFEETARLPGLHPDRARVILAGAVIARESLRRFRAGEAVISESDLLDALAASQL